MQLVSTGTENTPKPAPKRRREERETAAQNTEATPEPAVQPQSRGARRQRNQPRPSPTEPNNGREVALTRTLYDTPAADRRLGDENLIDHFIDQQEDKGGENSEREMLIQITKSGRRLGPTNPRAIYDEEGLEAYLITTYKQTGS